MRIIYDQSGLKPPGAIQPILPAGTIHRPVMVMRLVSDQTDTGTLDGRDTMKIPIYLPLDRMQQHSCGWISQYSKNNFLMPGSDIVLDGLRI